MVFQRTIDSSKLEELTSPYERHGFDKDVWEGDNIALLDSSDNLALFEFVNKGHYRGHYFFKSRGREAIAAAKEALSYIFSVAEVVEGWTPPDNKAALWMSRHLGFKSYGQLETRVGPMEHFIMTRKEFMDE